MKKDMNYYFDNWEKIGKPQFPLSIWKKISSVTGKCKMDPMSGLYCDKESEETNAVIFRFDVPFENFFKYGDPKDVSSFLSGAFLRTFYHFSSETVFGFIFMATDFGFTEEFKDFIFLHEIGHVKEDMDNPKNGTANNTVSEMDDEDAELEHEYYADEFATVQTNFSFRLVDYVSDLRLHQKNAYDFYLKYYLQKTDEEIADWNNHHAIRLHKGMLQRLKHQAIFIRLSKSTTLKVC